VWPTLIIVLALAAAAVILALNLNKPKLPDTSAPAPAEQSSQTAEPDVEAPETVVPDSAPIEEQVVPETEPEAAPAGEQGAAQDVDQVPADEPAPVQADPAQDQAAAPAPAPASADAMDEEAAITQEDAPAEPKYDHVVIIRATTNKGCWIGVWRGEETKMARDFVLRKGEPLRLMFNSPRRIRIGNVAGVTMTYNGEPYALDGSQGNIQTLTFGM
jgi:cytoskeleton protein RodZ